MISDDLFSKIQTLEKESEELIEQAKSKIQQLEKESQEKLAKLREEAQSAISGWSKQKKQELDAEYQTLKAKYLQMYEDISQRVKTQRDKYFPEVIEKFKKEMFHS